MFNWSRVHLTLQRTRISEDLLTGRVLRIPLLSLTSSENVLRPSWILMIRCTSTGLRIFFISILFIKFRKTVHIRNLLFEFLKEFIIPIIVDDSLILREHCVVLPHPFNEEIYSQLGITIDVAVPSSSLTEVRPLIEHIKTSGSRKALVKIALGTKDTSTEIVDVLLAKSASLLHRSRSLLRCSHRFLLLYSRRWRQRRQICTGGSQRVLQDRLPYP